MEDDSLAIFSKLEATLNKKWLSSTGLDVTDILEKIEKVTDGDVTIQFQGGNYIISGSLLRITAVHDYFADPERDKRLQMDLYEQSFGGADFTESSRSSSCRISDHQLASINYQYSHYESFGQSVATGSGDNNYESSTENTNDMLNYCAAEPDKHDLDRKTPDADTDGDNEQFVNDITEKEYESDHSEDVNHEEINICEHVHEQISSEVENVEEVAEVAPATKEILVDPDIWDYIRDRKNQQLQQAMDQFGATLESEWVPDMGLYKICLKVNQRSTSDTADVLHETLTLATEQFDELYKESFSTCAVEIVDIKLPEDVSKVEVLRAKFPSIIIKTSDGNILFVGPPDDARKAKRQFQRMMTDKSKKAGHPKGSRSKHRSSATEILTSSTADLSSSDMSNIKASYSSSLSMETSCSSIDDNDKAKSMESFHPNLQHLNDHPEKQMGKTAENTDSSLDYEHIPGSLSHQKSISDESFVNLKDGWDDSHSDAKDSDNK